MHQYVNYTYWEHLVCKYTNLSINEVNQLNYVEYLQYKRDAFIQMCSETEKGNEYLDNAWRIEQTEPDREGLRQRYGKGG